MSIKAPIYAVSSSNDSGYSAIFKQNGFDKPLAIYGHHVDNVVHQDAILQSPFTNQHVGGLQNRHLPINQGTDSPENRIENFAVQVSGGAIYVSNPRTFNNAGTPAYNKNIPYTPYARNVFIKRPVNIANIQYSTASSFIGNYVETYEFFQTSGRDINNFAFSQRGGYSVEFAESVFTSGTYDYSLPNRALINGTYDHSVFIEKFSAPGGPEVMSEGFLDTVSGQFSVYNALPYRNLSVRVPLNELMSIPMSISSAYQEGSTTTASFHKVEPNPRRIMVYSNVVTPTYATSSEEDDGNISHSIPRSDSQYTWITASINTSTDISTLFFLNVLSMSVTNERTSSYDGVNSFYGWPTWRQIRNYERTSAVYLRKNNIFAESIQSSATDVDNYALPLNSKRDFSFSLEGSKIITPITIKYKPVIFTVESLEG